MEPQTQIDLDCTTPQRLSAGNPFSKTIGPFAWALICMAATGCGDASSREPAGASNAAPPPDAPIAPEWCAALPRDQYAQLERVEIELDDPPSAAWYQVYRVDEVVYAIYEPHQWQEVISYLILGSERALLFDSGLGVAPIRPLIEQLTSLPVTVLNSHTHYDHVGGNYEFDEVWARDTPYTRARTSGQSNDALRAELAPDALCAPLPAGLSRDDFTSRAFGVERWIGERTSIDLGDRQLEVIAIPGHSPDSVALFDAQRGHLFTGDSFYEGPIWLFDQGTDLVAYRRSLITLEQLSSRARHVFTGHNTPRAPPRRLAELRRAFEAALAGDVEPELRADGIAVYEFEQDPFSFPFSLLVDPQGLERARRLDPGGG